MNCPKCNKPMEEGSLKLKADGFGSGLADFNAKLIFNGKEISHDQYKPIIGLFGIGGKKFSSFKCDGCSIICFEY